MLDAGEQVDLVGEPRLLEDVLGLVALVLGEDGVGLGGGDGEGPRDARELVLGHEGGVGEVAGLDAVLVVAYDVLQSRKEPSLSGSCFRKRV